MSIFSSIAGFYCINNIICSKLLAAIGLVSGIPVFIKTLEYKRKSDVWFIIAVTFCFIIIMDFIALINGIRIRF